MPVFAQRLQAALTQRRSDGLYRERLTLQSPQGAQVCVQGRDFLNFCSNDYLGLAAHPQLAARMREAAANLGVGSGASHLICGHTSAHQALEEALAEFTGRERALLFSSGYLANLGVLSALLEKGDYVFEDRLNHASLLDGGLHSPARFQRFPHNDVAALTKKLAAAKGPKLVVVDGIFSMDGDSAPLLPLAQACSAHDAWLMVDDAHGFGVRGESGAGSVEAAQLSAEQVPVLMATLGKALGSAGAFIAGSDDLIESLIQHARTYIYTTAIPPALAAASLTALQLLQKEAWRRDHLSTLVQRYRSGAQQLGLPLSNSTTAIQPLVVGMPQRAVAMSESLRERGVLVAAIRPPTVPVGTARLRIAFSAAHTNEQVDILLEQLHACWRECCDE